MRLIDTDAFKNNIKHRLVLSSLDAPQPLAYSSTDIFDLIDEQPTAEPIKHGHWKPLGKYDRECSCCYGIVDVTNYRYCPNCGARMDGGENG